MEILGITRGENRPIRRKGRAPWHSIGKITVHTPAGFLVVGNEIIDGGAVLIGKPIVAGRQRRVGDFEAVPRPVSARARVQCFGRGLGH